MPEQVRASHGFAGLVPGQDGRAAWPLRIDSQEPNREQMAVRDARERRHHPERDL